MGLFTILSNSEAVSLGKEHGLDVVRVEPLSAGSVNSNFVLYTRDKARYFARVYEEQGVAGARAELTLLRELTAAGVPTVAPLAPIASDETPTVDGKPFAIYPWVEGEILCQRRVTPEHCVHVGQALARLHLATSRLSALPGGRFDVSDIRQRLEGIERQSDEYAATARDLRRRLERYETLRNPTIAQGIIHGDLFRDNVLWRGEQLAALIDFESASRGTFAFDLMVTVEAWCFAEGFVPELVQSMLDGYHRTRPIGRDELSALPVEGAIAALRFATTRITDFSMRAAPGTPPARDFRRFIARLERIEAGVLDAALESIRT